MTQSHRTLCIQIILNISILFRIWIIGQNRKGMKDNVEKLGKKYTQLTEDTKTLKVKMPEKLMN